MITGRYAAQARHVIEEAAARVAPDAHLAGLAPDADLRDGLELDSLDFLRFVKIPSERTGRQIAEDDYPQLATLASTIKFLAGG